MAAATPPVPAATTPARSSVAGASSMQDRMAKWKKKSDAKVAHTAEVVKHKTAKREVFAKKVEAKKADFVKHKTAKRELFAKKVEAKKTKFANKLAQKKTRFLAGKKAV